MSYTPGIGRPSNGSNTTTALLGAGETFTGVAELNNLPSVAVSCNSDADGTLFFEFSVNGTDFTPYPTAGFNVAAGINEFHDAVKASRYFRVRYVNGATPQTIFNLYTYFGSFGQLTAPLNQSYSLDSDSTIVRPTWTWLDISRGLTSGLRSIKKFGRNNAVGTTYVPIALGGIYRTPQAASATTLRIKAGGDANDTAAGSGAREVRIEGLDENFNEVTETLATAGVSASASTTTTFTRLYRLTVSASGTYATASAGSHVGDIVIENTAGTEDWATIDATNFPKGQSEIGAYSVPTGATGYVKLRNLSADTGKTIDLVFFSRTNIDETTAPYSAMQAKSVITGVAGGSIEPFGDVDVPFGPFIGPTDLGFMGKLSAGTGTIATEFEIFVVDE